MKKSWVLGLCLILILSFFGNTGSVDADAKKQNLKMANGATYFGEVKNGKPHGKGTMKWSANKTYSGDWVNGKRSGQGKYTITNDEKVLTYDGGWKNDKQNGEGIRLTKSKEEYGANHVEQGSFLNNQFDYGDRLTSFNSYYFFEHEDAKNYIHFTTGEESIDKISNGILKDVIGEISNFKRMKSGLYKGYSYGYEPESAGSNYSTGIYKKNKDDEFSNFSIYEGKQNTYDESEFFLAYEYKKGKLSKKEKRYDIGSYIATLDKNLEVKAIDLKPYLKTVAFLKKVLN